jgi:peptidoglycan/xylan/chitin deacetylase (PgdA/CDA1 family)
MKRLLRFAIGVMSVCVVLPLQILAQGKGEKKQIAITFDELPVAKSFEDVPADGINYLILDALKKHNVKATGFVVSANIGTNLDVLGQWLNDGHSLGTMTLDNEDINDMTLDKFKKEVVDGVEELEPMLNGFGQKRRYFRFPFLHYGATQGVKSSIRSFIEGHNQVIAHATIVPEDFTYNNALAGLGKIPDSTRLRQLGAEYFNHVLQVVEKEERLAQQLAGRPVKQILLLKANRLNATFLDDLLTTFEEQGYSWVTLDKALKDEIYSHGENYTGLRGVGYLDMLAGGRKKK